MFTIEMLRETHVKEISGKPYATCAEAVTDARTLLTKTGFRVCVIVGDNGPVSIVYADTVRDQFVTATVTDLTEIA